ncbi:MAG: hypothetical protein HWN68_09725 [Desulfobacterales bacterium]|nr:hypothetical protein [Desulfobacterales bacterium]
MTTFAYVIDTSYLLELFKVPRFYDESVAEKVKSRITLAIESGSRLYVPLPCIFELGDHIGDVNDGQTRRRLAKELCEMLRTCVQQGRPFSIIPATGVEVLSRLCEVCAVFERHHAMQGIDLTDTSTIEEAKRLKRKYSGLSYRVHIWTKDAEMKAREPDREQNLYLG